MNSRFETDEQEGIVLARTIHYFRNSEQNLWGVSTKDIHEKGFLNFNYHPDQWNVGSVYSSFNAKGTKVNGLPVLLMDSWKIAIQEIKSGESYPASSMKSKKEGHNDGAILLARFSLEQLLKMGLSINIPFTRCDKKPYAKLTPEARNGKLFLKLKEGESLTEIDAGVAYNFDSEGYLFKGASEFFISLMLPIEEYRDSLAVFRPEDNKNSFMQKR